MTARPSLAPHWQWRAGMREGRGTEQYANGDTYIGTFGSDLKNGHGTYRHADGEVYEGAFVANTKEGRGSCKFANGQAYHGEFRGGRRHGSGTYRYSSGVAEVGEFRDGVDAGDGVRWTADRQRAWRLLDGAVVGEISLDEAREQAASLGLRVPCA